MTPSTRLYGRNQTWLPSLLNDLFEDNLFYGYPTVGKKQFATPAVNIKESAKAYDIEVAAPGMTKEDFKINLNEQNHLVISLEKKSENVNENKDASEKKQDKEVWLRREFSYASFSQTFAIPEDVNIEGITAKMENGVLMISLPKKEEQEAPKARMIDIM